MTGERHLLPRLHLIRLLLTDCDGVLTDGGVYYSAAGEEMKRFNIRDGMGVERLRRLGIQTGIITGERSPALMRRAEKLQIEELHLGIRDKVAVFEAVRQRLGLLPAQVAYIGDDCNDLELAGRVGFFACPADALPFVRQQAAYVCRLPGGHGAFREVAELIMNAQGGASNGSHAALLQDVLNREKIEWQE